MLLAPFVLGATAGWREVAADTGAGDAVPLWRLDRDAEGVYLTARVPLQLPTSLTDALQRGVPLHFVWHSELWRPRWYWTDRRLAQASRTVRLVFQPLTGRWRLSVHDEAPPDDGQAALQRSFDTLEEALALVRSVQRWRVAPAHVLTGDERLSAEFRIDTGRLPRPLQWLPGQGGADALPVWRTVLRVPALEAAVRSADAGGRQP